MPSQIRVRSQERDSKYISIEPDVTVYDAESESTNGSREPRFMAAGGRAVRRSRFSTSPDRLALAAVVMSLILILVAVTGSKAAVTQRAGKSSGYKLHMASYYGPGLFGNKTACGQTLSHHLHGVAHRSLPCGTIVKIKYQGHVIKTKVKDRGPYVDGLTYDLMYATAQDLNFNGNDYILVSYRR